MEVAERVVVILSGVDELRTNDVQMVRECVSVCVSQVIVEGQESGWRGEKKEENKGDLSNLRRRRDYLNG